MINGVGFCYRFAPAVAHARQLIAAGEIGEITHYRGAFLADYANRPDSAASWRFFRADAGSGALGDLMAHVVDLTHFLVGPIERLSGRTATVIPRRPPQPMGEGTHFTRVETDELVEVENEDWAAAQVEFGVGHGRVDRGQPRGRRAARRAPLRGRTARAARCAGSSSG